MTKKNVDANHLDQKNFKLNFSDTKCQTKYIRILPRYNGFCFENNFWSFQHKRMPMEKKNSQKKLVFKTILIRSLSILTEKLFLIYLTLLITTNTSVAASLVLIDIMVPLRVCISLNPQSAGEGGQLAYRESKRLFLWNRMSDWPQTRL